MEVSRRGSKALKHDISKHQQQLPTTGERTIFSEACHITIQRQE